MALGVPPSCHISLHVLLTVVEYLLIMDMNERDLEKLSKAELINLVEKLHNKARKPKIAIVDDGNGQVPQPPKPTRRIPPGDPKSGHLR